MKAIWTIKKMEEMGFDGILKEVNKGMLVLKMPEPDLVDLKNKLSDVLFESGFYLE
jgi:hypothetical protein